ncbi:MAG: hypothetical protein AAEJ04_01525, partial [Planctomycetota bacterium]
EGEESSERGPPRVVNSVVQILHLVDNDDAHSPDDAHCPPLATDFLDSPAWLPCGYLGDDQKRYDPTSLSFHEK